MPSASGKAKLKKKPESKEEHFARLEKLDKPVIGESGDDSWFHFDALYEEEDAASSDDD